MTEESRFDTRGNKTFFFNFLQSVETSSESDVNVLPNRCWDLSPWVKSGWGVELTTHLHLMSRLRMSGAICLLLLYAFMAVTIEPLTIEA